MKKIRNGMLAILVFIVGVSCNDSESQPLPKDEGAEPKETGGTPAHILESFELVWQDEFEGTALDLDKWNYRAEGSLRNHAMVSRQTISLDGKGNLVIEATKDGEGNYFVGQTGTDGLYQTRYGYFECRARMNKQLGPHVAFWLQSNTMGVETDNPRDNGAEVDIFEYHRKTPHNVHHNIHWNGYGEAHRQVGTEIPVDSIGEGFHTFGLEWTEDEYIFYVNGKETWRTSEAVSRRPQYLILSTELTGFGGAHDHNNYPDSVLFDYVRVYKRK